MNALKSWTTKLEDGSHTILCHNIHFHLLQKRHGNKQPNDFLGILSFYYNHNPIFNFSYNAISTNSSTNWIYHHKKEAYGLFFNYTTFQARRNENVTIQNNKNSSPKTFLSFLTNKFIHPSIYYKLLLPLLRCKYHCNTTSWDKILQSSMSNSFVFVTSKRKMFYLSIHPLTLLNLTNCLPIQQNSPVKPFSSSLYISGPSPTSILQ